MNDPKMTHILFIDADIIWNPYDIIKMLMNEKQIVGGAYPLKNYHWERNTPEMITKLIEKKNNSVFNKIPDENLIQTILLDYNVNYLSNDIKIENNLTQVRHLANGFLMIERNVIEKMSIAFEHTKYKDDIGALSPEENKFAYGLFDCAVEDGHYLSEDWLFCHRWRKMGGDVWLNVSIQLSHIGNEIYNGSYLHSIAI
jgi:hypothetical protein